MFIQIKAANKISTNVTVSSLDMTLYLFIYLFLRLLCCVSYLRTALTLTPRSHESPRFFHWHKRRKKKKRCGFDESCLYGFFVINWSSDPPRSPRAHSEQVIASFQTAQGTPWCPKWVPFFKLQHRENEDIHTVKPLHYNPSLCRP